VTRGHAVRGTTRDPARAVEIEALGAEPVVSDPDRIATLARAFDHVGVACLLLGSATGTPEQLEALHGSRLEMLLTRMIDTTVRGVVYESAGSVDGALLRSGAARVREACEGSLIPYVLLDADPGEPAEWLAAAVGAVEQVLSAP
jgi:uncharacterized protein YbjT (DUF2867 family)